MIPKHLDVLSLHCPSSLDQPRVSFNSYEKCKFSLSILEILCSESLHSIESQGVLKSGKSGIP